MNSIIHSGAKVETAIPSDEDEIYELCCMLHAENAKLSFDENRVRGTIRRATNKDKAILGVIRQDDRVVACICLSLDDSWYSPQVVVNELFNFVHVDYRRSDYAKMLIEFAKEVSDRLEMMLFVGIFTNIRTEAKVRLYSRQLEPAGAYFIHNERFMNKEAA